MIGRRARVFNKEVVRMDIPYECILVREYSAIPKAPRRGFP
jgi:hypothetical protein